MRTATTEPKEIKVKTVERTLMLLEIMAAESTPLSLTKLGKISKLSVSTTYRLLSTLCRSGFIEKERATGHYKLGLKSFLIGNAALQSVELRPTALPYMENLSKSCGETVYLAILSNQNVIYSDCIKTATPFQIGIQTGMPLPACQSSSGKVLLAHLVPTEVEHLVTLYLTGQILTDRLQFVTELENIKTQGGCIGINSLNDSIRELSVPIFNHLGICAAAISILRPAQTEHLSVLEENLFSQLKESGQEISQAMGFLSHNTTL